MNFKNRICSLITFAYKTCSKRLVWTKKTTLEDLSVGSLFLYKKTCALKTEYIKKDGWIECYIVGTGEFFTGETNSVETQRSLKVVEIKLRNL